MLSFYFLLEVALRSLQAYRNSQLGKEWRIVSGWTMAVSWLRQEPLLFVGMIRWLHSTTHCSHFNHFSHFNSLTSKIFSLTASALRLTNYVSQSPSTQSTASLKSLCNIAIGKAVGRSACYTYVSLCWGSLCEYQCWPYICRPDVRREAGPN